MFELKQIKAGQSLIEYIIIVGVVMTAVYFMAPALKRGTQSVIKATADQLGTQEEAEQDYSKSSSHMENSMSSAFVNNARTVYGSADGIRTIVSETSQTFTNTVTNAGIN